MYLFLLHHSSLNASFTKKEYSYSGTSSNVEDPVKGSEPGSVKLVLLPVEIGDGVGEGMCMVTGDVVIAINR